MKNQSKVAPLSLYKKACYLAHRSQVRDMTSFANLAHTRVLEQYFILIKILIYTPGIANCALIYPGASGFAHKVAAAPEWEGINGLVAIL